MTEINILIFDEPESVGSIQTPASMQRALDDFRTNPDRLDTIAQEIEEEIGRRWNLMKPGRTGRASQQGDW
ncbi:hypothetical protein ACT17_11680 [Mycolicibacterium conceptionense]|jgi:hypothetical protein|uniref:Uncharacterized protein n=1 Tax=Mycolicibacterium conceptionense TaxID=451644 RepID=A0A0J8UA77_9MYCO|nr:hypothetical protein [Mycolicibacterium conceptionense]KMV18291.1 hypothetical protein ACT17_11680 [Mycolicibacterium conceptionense]